MAENWYRSWRHEQRQRSEGERRQHRLADLLLGVLAVASMLAMLRW